ncbi:receptor-like kinase TMK4 [Gastrolobium bilobum]|uniref:receptor-like kinase TMK4 n=1 Tax=Gastrolobium bilobum TaxID=150636 RepID=UPI002AB227B8|nr:receptor-like kinase TMK4 [Gastrolobium bilobum]
MAGPKLKSKSLVSLSTLLLLFSLLSTAVVVADDGVFMSKLEKAISPRGWSATTAFCSWNGVKCDSSNRVTTIHLASELLTGTLPSDLNSLSQLTDLSLQGNSLSGSLPSLANLTMLITVYLDGNNFTSIPDGCFQGLTSLQNLSLTYNINLVPWTFPAELTQSIDLVQLDLGNSNIMGSLPDVFDSFVSLQGLDISYNNFTGSLPKSFAGSGIKNLWLNNQRNEFGFSGSIYVLSSMTSLSRVWLMENQFTGPIPDYSNCTNLFDLQLKDNLLTGVVPPSLMALSSLGFVSLDNNMLQGPVPVFGQGVVTLDGNNSFCQSNPGVPCDPIATTLLDVAADFGYPLQLASAWKGNKTCQDWSFIVCEGGNITTVNLAKQNLTGTISPAFANLTDLRNLFLNDNNLVGSIPWSLTTLPQLEVLDVSNNNLSGEVPNFSAKVKFIAAGNVLLGLPGDGGNGTSPSSGSGDAPSGSPSKTANGSSLSPAWIVGIAIFAVFCIIGGVVAGLLICITIFCLVCKSTSWRGKFWLTTKGNKDIEEFLKNHGAPTLKRYKFSNIKKMTDSFKNKLGQGGFGAVYKGQLFSGCPVAAKILRSSKGNNDDFINEVASISRTSHVNVVALLGFCLEGRKKALIYEFMSNGSLEKFIHRKGHETIASLSWEKLYQIAVGIARGLEYLHRGCNTRILHFDIKPHNILLDEDFCPKISDFGLAKLCPKKESIISMSDARGTIGYVAPEMWNRHFGGVSHKSDVYSYGMLLLEMVGATKNINAEANQSSEIYFPHWVYDRLEQGRGLRPDEVMTTEENEITKRLTVVGLWCTQTFPNDRPTISRVIDMLEGNMNSLEIPPRPTLSSPTRPASESSTS